MLQLFNLGWLWINSLFTIVLWKIVLVHSILKHISITFFHHKFLSFFETSRGWSRWRKKLRQRIGLQSPFFLLAYSTMALSGLFFVIARIKLKIPDTSPPLSTIQSTKKYDAFCSKSAKVLTILYPTTPALWPPFRMGIFADLPFRWLEVAGELGPPYQE